MPEFARYRVIQKTIHIGGSEESLNQNEIILFDGSTIRRESGTEIKLTHPDSLRGAIKVGWIVPEASSETTFRPKPAGIEVRSAVSTGETRDLVTTNRVQDEERDVGDRQEIRNIPPQNQKRAAAPSENSGEGKVVGRLKNSAKSGPIEIGKDDRSIVSKLENKSQVEVEKFGRKVEYTGDVREAISGDELTQLLPDAAKSEPPRGGVYKEAATTSSGSSSVGTQDEGRLVSRAVREQTPAPAPALSDDFLKKLAETLAPMIADLVIEGLAQRNLAQAPVPDIYPTPEAYSDETIDPDVRNLLAELDEALPQEFSWNTALHWKTRQRDLKEKFWDDVEALTKIAKLDPSKAVSVLAEDRLKELA